MSPTIQKHAQFYRSSNILNQLCCQYVIIQLLCDMKKTNTPMMALKKATSNPEAKKEDHFSHFQNLGQKLLLESDKLTTLIACKALSTTDKDTPLPSNSCQEILEPPSPLARCGSLPYSPQEPVLERKPSELMRAYMENKAKISAISEKTKKLKADRQREGGPQRKYTYNFVGRQLQAPSRENQSPSKSERIADCLKTTASTTCSSPLMRTIAAIQRMGSKTSLLPSSRPLSIHDFQILKYLQEGQFGSVYTSRHIPSNFLCALKKIPKQIFQGDPRFIGQLVRQIKIQSYLDHPNIAQLYGFFSDEDNLYLMMELCCGGNTYHILKKEGRLNEQRVRNIIKQVCFAIEFMHDNDIIHRDLKLENLLLHEDIVKVCDFGWSIHSPLLRDTRCGTPLYSSPEVIQQQQYDNKIDVWNIGILTYELLYGRVPFEIRAVDDLVKVVDEDIYFPRSIPISCQAKDFILKCLVKNPKERPSMNRLVDHEFIHP